MVKLKSNEVLERVDKKLMGTVVHTILTNYIFNDIFNYNSDDLCNLIELYTQKCDDELKRFYWLETEELNEELSDFTPLEILEINTKCFNEHMNFHIIKENIDKVNEIISFTKEQLSRFIMDNDFTILTIVLSNFEFLKNDLYLSEYNFTEGFVAGLNNIYDLYLWFEKIIYKLD